MPWPTKAEKEQRAASERPATPNMRATGDRDTHYDYDRQAWVVNGRYVDCGHPKDFGCLCYGRLHDGEAEINDPEPAPPICPRCGQEVEIEHLGVHDCQDGIAGISDN